MSAVVPLGTFERVALRDAWPTEDGNFTPWLAQPETIKLLGSTLNIDLEVEAVEHWVGPFRADILARVADEDDHRVIIENQFGRTDHNHLGQVLTYLAGIENAKTVVWISETIQADHRAAIDWLNANTVEPFSFFAIEIELWRINNSPPAPRFNVVASPNDWTKSVRAATRQVEGELVHHQQVSLAYWASFADHLRANKSPFQIRRPVKGVWFDFPIGRQHFEIRATISTENQRVGVELYKHDDVGKVAFRTLLADKNAIEAEFGEPLDWQELPEKKASRIAIYKTGVDPADENQRPGLHEWMFAKMERFQRVFAARVKAINLDIGNDEPLESVA